MPLGMAHADGGVAPGSPQVAQAGVTAAGAPVPENAALDLLLRKAEYWIGQQEYDKATEVVREARSIAPDSSRALYDQGRIQIGTGDAAAAGQTLRQLSRNGDASSYIGMLNAQIRYGKLDPQALAEARHLAETGKMMQAMFKYKALFKNGDPPPDLALEYYRVLGSTILGYQEARTKLGEYVAHSPEDLDARLAYDRILTYRITNREQGLSDLKVLARTASSSAIRQDAAASWRLALTWEPITGSSMPLYREWLEAHPDDAEIRDLLQKAQETQSGIDAATYRIEGYKFLSRKDYVAAARSLHQALALNPDDPDTLGGLGVVAEGEQRLEDAKKYFAQAVAADPAPDSHWRTALQHVYAGGGPDPLVGNAQSAIDEGRLAAAQDDIDRLRQHPGATEAALFLQAALYRKQGRLDEAARVYREIQRISPHNPEAPYNLAYVLIQQGRGDEADDLIRLVAQKEPRRASLLRGMQLRYAAAHTGDLTRRIALLRSALAYMPDNPWVYLELGNALYDNGQVAQADAHMRQLTSGRDVTDADIEAGVLYAVAHHDITTAARLYARLPPSARTPAMVQAERQIRLTQMVRAIDPQAPDYRDQLMALANAPDPDGTLGTIIATAFMDRDDPRSARKVLRYENQITPNPEPEQKLGYAGTSLRIGSLRDAQAYLKDFDQLAAENPDGITSDQMRVREQIEIGMTIMKSDRLDQGGKPGQAEKLMLPLVAANPDSAEAHLALGRVYETQDRARHALGEDLAALKLRQNDRYILASIVRDATGAGDLALAHEYMQRLTELAPDSSITWEVRSEIDRVEGHAREQLADLERAHDLQCSSSPSVKCNAPDAFVPDYMWPDMEGDHNEPKAVTLSAMYPSLPSDTVLQATERNIAYLRESLAPQIDANVYIRGRTGARGQGQMTEVSVPITGSYPLSSWEHRLTFSATPTFLFTGNPGQSTSIYNPSTFGTQAVNGGKARDHYNIQGIALGVSYMNRWFTGDVGTSPLGFPITNVVGGVEFAPQLARNLRLRISGGRRMVTDSELSYGGMTDPATGRTWGGVTRIFGHGSLEYASALWTAYVGGGGAYLEGTNVVSNTEGEARAGGNAKVWRYRDRQALRVGLDLMYFGYERNTYFFTLGQGGVLLSQRVLRGDGSGGMVRPCGALELVPAWRGGVPELP
ncbi:cellulose synthase subunit BcsC-related outer membrane protein [Komagataeibacter sp. FNDCR2]|uniref:cellulose synthase subunit BcsC-related outer membrane protein n=1 Tax=Komagataeibacter sp. FNDCR2 TaxID=2878682 RepID=UPI002101EAC1|nr:cellulose synthase subunit BcsC-related outer membrane protein [Komagataeibacter sp. FNDCR2]